MQSRMKNPISLPVRRKKLFKKSKRPIKRIHNLEKRVSKIQRDVELKYLDVLVSNTSIPTTSVFTLLNGCVTGDTSVTREGSELRMTSLQFRLEIKTNSAQLGASHVRFCVVKDQDPDGGAPSIAEIFGTTIITDQVLAPYNYNNSKRFRILYDRTIDLNPGSYLTADTTGDAFTVLTVVPEKISIVQRIPLNYVVKFGNGNAGTIADFTMNSLYMVCFGDAAANQPTFDLGSRVYFKDS